MRVLALNPPFFKKFSRSQRSPGVTKSGTLYFPLWLSYCVGVLKADGFETSFIDAPARDVELPEILALAKRENFELIILDTSTPSIANDLEIAAKLKEILPQCFILLVGTHVSALPGKTLQDGPATDAVARREYEYTARDLARLIRDKGRKPTAEELSGIPGLSYRQNSDIIDNPERPFIENLDELPFVSRVYREYLQISDYFNPNALFPMLTLVTSRGCPFKCSFCVYPQTLTGRAYRFRGIDNVLDEIEYALAAFPEARSIFFEDDTLTSHKKRCLAFSEAIIKRGLKFSWTANSRVDLDYETMLKMRQSGCRMLCVGFESGDPEILKTMKKGTTLERMHQFMADAKKAGILIHGCFIIGFPGENLQSVHKTFTLAKALEPDTVQFYPVMVYPGTEAYGQYVEQGWITTQDFSRWLTPEGLHNCVIRNEFFSPEELVRLCDQARRDFYLRPGYILKKLAQAVSDPGEFIRTAKAAKTFLKHLLFGSRV